MKDQHSNGTEPYINSAWRSVLIGGLRAGGKGLFALDVTDPDNFGADDILWEFDSTDDADFGYSYSKPTVAMMENGQWAVITGNGYNNDGSGTAQLFILFIEGGTDGVWTEGVDYIKIDTGVDSESAPNGLSTPMVVDTNGDSIADRIYAGDLQGNMWAFDVSDGKEEKWEVAYEWDSDDDDLDENPAPIFTALNDDDEMQPITSAPTVTINPSDDKDASDLLVLFGTGKYLESSDVSGNKQKMSYYAIGDDKDRSEKIEVDDDDDDEKITRTNLVKRELLTTSTGLRSIIGSDIDWKNDDGWYVDLPVTGERVISDSLVRNNVLFFNTIIPTGDACSSGGDSWLMSVDLETGLAPSFAVFDANGDTVIDKESETVTVENDINGDGVVDDGDVGYVGQYFNNGLASESSILSSVQYTVGSTGTISERDVNTGANQSKGRVSWQELLRP